MNYYKLQPCSSIMLKDKSLSIILEHRSGSRCLARQTKWEWIGICGSGWVYVGVGRYNYVGVGVGMHMWEWMGMCGSWWGCLGVGGYVLELRVCVGVGGYVWDVVGYV